VERSGTSVKDVEFITPMEDDLIFNFGRTYKSLLNKRDLRDRMIVGFATTCAINA
jgi:hypothetical protein